MKKYEHTILNLVSVTAPVILSFFIGCILTGKLFNMEIPFSTLDYALLIMFSFIIFMLQKERFNNLQKWSKELSSKHKNTQGDQDED